MIGMMVRAIRAEIDAVVRRFVRGLRDAHQPLPVDGDPYVLCSRCSNGWTGKQVSWPCDEWVRLDGRLGETVEVFVPEPDAEPPF